MKYSDSEYAPASTPPPFPLCNHQQNSRNKRFTRKEKRKRKKKKKRKGKRKEEKKNKNR